MDRGAPCWCASAAGRCCARMEGLCSGSAVVSVHKSGGPSYPLNATPPPCAFSGDRIEGAGAKIGRAQVVVHPLPRGTLIF